ncbi:MAG: apolipoprotein acyltransferase [Rhodobacteraceae bacterium]|nr:apolipoprotein acyltransferase [Paracoccaceae bacterium]
MLVILGALLGVFLGARSAMRRNGNRFDIFQFCAVYALAYGLAGLFLTLAAGWLGIGFSS